MTMNEQMLAGVREAMALLQREGPAAATVKIQDTIRGLRPMGERSGEAAPARGPVECLPGASAGAGTRGALGGLVPALLARLGREASPEGARFEPLRGLRPLGERSGEAAAPRGPGDLLPGLSAGAGTRGALGGSVAALLARLGREAPLGGARFELPSFAPPADAPAEAQAPGRFLSGSFTNAAGTRAYKLYVPTAYEGQALPLVVMLHGCTQTPDDFAAGTRWNAVAEEAPCLVLYPAQSPAANGMRCWNWFDPADQQRDRGEPSILAGMTREIVETWHADPTRVYVAGLSAGGAMAAVLAAAYPEVYAALGIHSGVPYGAASDLGSALQAMRGAAPPVATESLQGMPTIVFHGDRDRTVHPCNGERIVAQTTPRQARAHIKTGQTEAGHGYTRTVHEGPDGAALAEHWVVHGAGHAWSGGSPRGSFADGQGPDASREMMRFFAARSKPQGGAAR